MTNAVIDLNAMRQRILAGEEIPPEELYQAIQALRTSREEGAEKSTKKRTAKGNLSQAELEQSLSIFDNLPKAATTEESK